MNPNKISSDDPRLTAYALNEMAPAERTEFEQLLAEDAAARQAVEEIAATASLLTDALEHEALEPMEKSAPRHDTYAKVIQFPYWKISGLAAACFAVFFIYWQRHGMVNEPKQYIEVPLAPAPAADVPEPEPAATTAPAPREAERANRDERQSVALARMAKQEQEGAVKEQMIVLSDTGFHAKAGDPPNLKVCSRGTWNTRMLIETVLSMLTTVCHLKHLTHRVWAYFEMHLGFMMAAFNLLVQWHGWKPDKTGFFPLTIAEFSL